MKIPGAAGLLTLVLLGGGLWAGPSQNVKQELTDLSQGSYRRLSPAQRQLVDDWYRRFNEVSGKNLEPATAWRKVPLSARTTFEAVTNALERNELTDKQGQPIGKALDLVARLDWVAGRVHGVRGDHQFRIYVTLKSEAVETLERSQQYSRGMDNSVFHKGYPINYRQPGTPSNQFSITRDGRHADIDVDYRSSRFPKALVDGHLTAANSDVRAGGNYRTHTRRWEGLYNWWEHLFGLSLSFREEGELTAVELPSGPRAHHQEPQDAAHDFLQAWLVEDKPDEAMGYVSRRAAACMESDTSGDFDPGMAQYQVLADMRRANEARGEVETLAEAVVGVRLLNPDLKVVEQSFHQAFVLYDVPEDLATAFLCENRHLPDQVLPETSQDYGKYFAAVFYLKAAEEPGEPIALLWAKEDGHWRVVAVEGDVNHEHNEAVPDTRPEGIDLFEPKYGDEDPEFVAAAGAFAKDWLIDKNYDRAVAYLDPESHACPALYHEEHSANEGETRRAIRESMRTIAEDLVHEDTGRPSLEAADPAHEHVHLIRHEESQRFSLFAVPSHLASATRCSSILDQGGYRPTTVEELEHGPHRGSGMYMRLTNGSEMVIYFLWERRQDSWRIVSYHVETP